MQLITDIIPILCCATIVSDIVSIAGSSVPYDMIQILVCVSFVFVLEIKLVAGSSIPNDYTASSNTIAYRQTKLLDKLLDHYDKRVLPQRNASHSVSMSFGIQLLNLVELYEHEEMLETSVYLQQFWDDFRLSWDPSRYEGLHTIHIPIQDIWKPDISLYNNADVHLELMNSLAVVFSDGKVFYSPRAIIRTRCDMDLTKFPYDQQQCRIKFGSYVYDGNTLFLSHFPNNNDSLDMSDYKENKQWAITSTSYNIVAKTYPCCKEVYQHLDFGLTLKRNSVYYTQVFVVPAVILAIIVPFQFLLPPDSRERLSIGSILLLACILMITMIQNYLPTAHPTLPYIVQYYSLTLVMVTISLICSIWVINIHNRGPRKTKVPEVVRQLFLNTLKKLVCLNEDNYYPLDGAESISMRGIDSKQSLISNDQSKNGDSKLEKDVEELLRHVSTLVRRGHVMESRKNMMSEWCQVAIIFDRILCFVFMLIFIVYSCVLLS